MERVIDYARANLTTLKELDREKTVCLMAVSPLEAHGPHLPLGTDVSVAEEVQRRLIARISERPGFRCLVLPPLYAGSDVVPYRGSVNVPAPAFKNLLLAYAGALAAQGFRYLLVTDNHGGPGHQIAMEKAARQAWRKWRFYLLNPFGRIYRKMVCHDRDFLARIDLAPGTCGDDADSHAGTNETSLLLAIDSNLVDANYRQVPANRPKPLPGLPRLLSRLARLAAAAGLKPAAQELDHLAATLAWVGDRQMLPYMGDPALASREAGERMLEAHMTEAMNMLEEALSGQLVYTTPLLWWLRLLR
ncbi:MAG: creatininase family protein [Bacillota bacterium]